MEWYLKVLRNYANFKGRARRKEYWMFTLFQMIMYFASRILEFIAFRTDSKVVAIALLPLMLFFLLYFLATLIPSLAVAVRRMHDTGNSGWFMLIPIYSFILTVTEGEQGENQYGQDPKEEELMQSIENFGK